MRCGDELFEEMYAWWIQFPSTNKALEDQISRGKHVPNNCLVSEVHDIMENIVPQIICLEIVDTGSKEMEILFWILF